MGNLRAYFGTVLALTAAACGGDSDAKPDGPVVVIPDASIDAQAPDAPVDAAPMFDFSCANNPAPTTAPNPLTVSGTVTDIDLASQEAEPVAMALVTARQSSNNAPIGTPQTTPGDGSFTISAPSGGMPIDGYVEASKTGHRTVRVYPPAPLSADFTGVPALLLSNATFNFVVQFAGAQQDADKGKPVSRSTAPGRRSVARPSASRRTARRSARSTTRASCSRARSSSSTSPRARPPSRRRTMA
jgi:hypothetical protein